MTERERIYKVIKYLRDERKIIDKHEDLCNLLNIKSRSYLSQLVTGRINNRKFMRDLCRLDPRLNYRWIINEEGEMFLNENTKEVTNFQEETNKQTDISKINQELNEPNIDQDFENLKKKYKELWNKYEILMDNYAKLIQTISSKL